MIVLLCIDVGAVKQSQERARESMSSIWGGAPEERWEYEEDDGWSRDGDQSKVWSILWLLYYKQTTFFWLRLKLKSEDMRSQMMNKMQSLLQSHYNETLQVMYLVYSVVWFYLIISWSLFSNLAKLIHIEFK